MQSRWNSLLEAKLNLVLPYPITWAIYVWVIPWMFYVRVNSKQATGFIVVFSASSLIRQYALRRFFVHLEKRKK